MKIAVTTPTGNIGSKLTALLLEGGAEVTLLVRDPKKVQPFVSKGAKALQGDLIDRDFLTRATEGMDALFWVSPVDLRSPDPRSYQTKMGETVAHVVRTNRIPRIVNISSLGAHIPVGTGPIAGLGRIERSLNETGAAIRHLRPTYFMENYLMSIDPIRNMGSIFLSVAGSARIPMIATRDIAKPAAQLLLDPSWTGQQILGLHGPEDLTYDEAARAIAEGISRPVRHVQVPPEKVKEGLLAMGASPAVADLYLEMEGAISEGKVKSAEQRTPETTTPTTLTAFAREVIKPLL